VTPRRRRAPDESDIRARPNPRGSRPRTKERPQHEGAVAAQVVSVDRGRYGCLLGGFGAADFHADAAPPLITAMKARELGRAGVVVGDRVALVGDVSGAPDTLARVVRVQERVSVLRRSADDTDPVERVLVANAEQLAVVVAAAEPEPRARLVDRCLVAAYDAGLAPLLVMTKADLADPAPFLAEYAALDVPTVITRRGPAGIEGLHAVHQALAGRVTVLVGHSGVGQSTLVNALVPGAGRATGRVNDVTGRGRHTSASAVALLLPPAGRAVPGEQLPPGHHGVPGWVVDTPGVRSFGLAHITADRILRAFPDLLAGTDDCPRGCGHDEPECGLDAFAAAGGAGPAGPVRLDSLRRLLRSRPATPGGHSADSGPDQAPD
jgi:ribosome biogenesis GTPase